MAVSKGKNFTERQIEIYFAKHCSYGKRAENWLSVAEKPKDCFSFVCTWTIFMVLLAEFCAVIYFSPRLSVVYIPERYKQSVSLSEFSSPVSPHSHLSLRMMTVFISCSPQITEAFASLRPDCLFFCTRILKEYFPWSLVVFLFRSFWSLFL